MFEALNPWMHLIGRVLLAIMFVNSGIGHLTHKGTVAYAQSKGVPAPKVMVPLTGVMIVVGAVLVVLGWHRFIGAGLLAIFLLPTAFIMHAFWKEKDPMARMGERVHFLKDLALLGGALLLAYYAGWSWPLSLGG
jgi:uncharacterized membrane protein YphA (DoxX/SURF4 family)